MSWYSEVTLRPNFQTENHENETLDLAAWKGKEISSSPNNTLNPNPEQPPANRLAVPAAAGPSELERIFVVEGFEFRVGFAALFGVWGLFGVQHYVGGFEILAGLSTK